MLPDLSKFRNIEVDADGRVVISCSRIVMMTRLDPELWYPMQQPGSGCEIVSRNEQLVRVKLPNPVRSIFTTGLGLLDIAIIDIDGGNGMTITNQLGDRPRQLRCYTIKQLKMWIAINAHPRIMDPRLREHFSL